MLTLLKYIYANQITTQMNRKFNHEDIAMIGGLIAMVGAIMFNLINTGTI